MKATIKRVGRDDADPRTIREIELLLRRAVILLRSIEETPLALTVSEALASFTRQYKKGKP